MYCRQILYSLSHQGCRKCGVPYTKWAFLVAQTVKNLLARQEIWVRSLSWDDSLEERVWQPTLVFLPGESPWMGSWRATAQEVTKSQTTERLSAHIHILSREDHRTLAI